MIIKNILINAKDGIIEIHISDAKMAKNNREKKVSNILDKFLEEIIQHEDFKEIINL